MNDVEKQFRDRVGNLLGDYCPNDTSLNNFSVFLFREVIDVLLENKGEARDILVNHKKNTDMDKMTFLKSVKDLSVSCTQDLVNKVFAKSFTELKNMVPMSVVVVEGRKSNNFIVRGDRESDLNRNVGNFDDLDIEDIPKVSRKGKKNKGVKKEEIPNVFNGVDLDIDEINQRTVKSSSVIKSTVKNLNQSKGRDNVEGDSDFIIDASDVTSESYSNVPKVDIDIDY